MLSDSEQRSMKKDLRVIANGVTLPFWIVVVAFAGVLWVILSISALMILRYLLKFIC